MIPLAQGEYNLNYLLTGDQTRLVLRVNVGTQIDLALAAELAGVDVDTIYTFNPGYNRWSTDPQGPHKLVLPLEAVDTFETAVQDVPAGELVRWKRHR